MLPVYITTKRPRQWQNNNHQGYRYTLHLVLEFPLSGEVSFWLPSICIYTMHICMFFHFRCVFLWQRSMKGRLRSIGMSSTSDIKTESASVITLNFLIIAISKGSSSCSSSLWCHFLHIRWQFGKPLILGSTSYVVLS